MSEKSKFQTLNEINVNEHVEKKGNFTYLSWPWAVQQLRIADPNAFWEVIKHDGKPFVATDNGYFVEVAVTVNGITLSQIHPVLDNNNKTIPMPNAFQINTSIQRCLVKAIALHGLGLYLYAGEDLPEADMARREWLNQQTISIKTENIISKKYDKWEALKKQLSDNDEIANAWGMLDSTTRREIKTHGEDLQKLQEEEAKKQMDA